MDNITLANTMLANTLRDSLVEIASNGKFKTLLTSILESPKFRKALDAANVLFGETAPVRRKGKKAAKKAVKRTKRVATKKSTAPVDPNAPKPKRGRPKGSKNKPKVPVAPEADMVPASPTFTDLELATETV